MLRLQYRTDPSRFVRLTGPVITMGQDSSNDIVIDGVGISDFHAEIVRQDGQLFILDLLSAVGTFVNDERISGRREVKPWDVIRLGSVELEINDPSTPRPSVWGLLAISDSDGESYFPLNGNAVLGRAAECDLTFSSDLLSRQHLELRPAETFVHVIDLGSSNGTYLNGTKITESKAVTGDEIRIESLLFRIAGPKPTAAESNEAAAVVTQLGPSPPESSGQLAQPVVEATELLDTEFEAVSLVEISAVLGLAPINITTATAKLGRHPDCDFVLPDRSVSQYHARVYYEARRWYIEDLGSSNGVKVNAERVQSVSLHHNDVLRLGRIELRFVHGG